MVVPLAARCIAAALGAALVLVAWASIIQTLLIPRPAGNWLPRMVNRVVLSAFRLATRSLRDLHLRDQALAPQAAAILLLQLAGWLVTLLAGFTLVLWPFARAGITSSIIDAGEAHCSASATSCQVAPPGPPWSCSPPRPAAW